MTYSTILFDLDGTLSDPADGIVSALRYAFQKMELAECDEKVLLQFIGPPLAESFQHFCGLSSEEIDQAIHYYREYFSEKGLFENRLYDGISGLLQELKKAGKKLIIATSKPEFYAQPIVEYFGISADFDFIAGATLDGSRSKKADVIAYALSATQTAPDEAVMVGDRKFDIDGAKQNRLDSIGVLYGYGSREELDKAGATQIVRNVEELRGVLLESD